MKFKAKTQFVDQNPSDFDIPIDKDGYVQGYYVDGYIVGDFVEANEEYTSLEWWCPVDVSTLKEVKEHNKTCWCYFDTNVQHNGPVFEPLFKNKFCPSCGRKLEEVAE